MGFIGSWLATFIATLAAINLVPGIVTVGGTWFGPIMVSLVLALINASIKPVIQLIGLPFTILTLGIFSLVINACLLELASFLARNILGAGIYIESFGSALIGAIVISIVSMIIDAVTGIG
jgi:putative membrane protein